MEQVLTNLIFNATFHTPAGTAIELSVQREEQQCVIIVADSGPGIPQSDIKKVFDKFYRVEGASTGGTGLGLPIARGFIEAQHGTLTVRNRPSGGVEFKIEIPITTDTTSI